MRKFYIENELNERFDLQSSSVFFMDPGGLGVDNTLNYIQIGDSFINDYKAVNQSNISGKIEFIDPGAYKNARSFFNWCARAKKLYLVYDAGDGVEYMRDIDIASFDKSERNGGTLPIGAKFNCKSLYYLKNNSRFLIEPVEEEMRFDFTFDKRFSDFGSYELNFNNDGHTEAPFDCLIYGYVSNPIIQVYQDDLLISEVIFPVTLEKDEYIHFCTRDGMLEVTKYGEKIENLMPLLDIEKENFFKIPIGASKIKFISDFATTNTIIMNVFKMYKIV